MLATDPVLLIEDNDDMREALARLLRIRGYRVVQTRDGQEAWEYLERGGPASIIVLDLLMPRMDGRLFRARQLGDAELARIPVVVFSVLAAAVEALPDVAAHVRKSDPETLLEVIERVASVQALDD
jgi:CheY-like chemotaxis protein